MEVELVARRPLKTENVHRHARVGDRMRRGWRWLASHANRRARPRLPEGAPPRARRTAPGNFGRHRRDLELGVNLIGRLTHRVFPSIRPSFAVARRRLSAGRQRRCALWLSLLAQGRAHTPRALGHLPPPPRAALHEHPHRGRPRARCTPYKTAKAKGSLAPPTRSGARSPSGQAGASARRDALVTNPHSPAVLETLYLVTAQRYHELGGLLGRPDGTRTLVERAHSAEVRGALAVELEHIALARFARSRPQRSRSGGDRRHSPGGARRQARDRGHDRARSKQLVQLIEAALSSGTKDNGTINLRWPCAQPATLL